jgi:DNA-binding phage protein
MVSELIDDLEVQPQEISCTSVFLKRVANNLFGGNSAALARHLGLSKSQLHGWMHDGILPSLSCVARIATAFDCSMSDVISGHPSNPRLQHGRKFPRGLFGLRRRSGYKTPRKKLLASLSAFMKGNPDSNAKNAAIHLGVSQRFLRDNFPEQNKALVNAGRFHRQQTAQARRDAIDHAYENLHRTMKSSGVYPSRRKVMKQLKEQGIGLSFADERRAQQNLEGGC